MLAVVDGDTLDLHIDLGFGVYRKLRARLAGVDAPELTTEAGRQARDFLAQELLTTVSSAVQTVRVDLHGRYLGHFFFALHCNECEAKETRVSGAARTSTSRRPDSAHRASNVRSEQAPTSMIS